MSRSFYVDSLIMKRPVTQSLSTANAVTLSNAFRQSIPTSHILTPHPLPSYPRHSADMMSLCCPLCIHTPTPLIPEHSASIPSSTPTSFISTTVNSLHKREFDLQKQKTLEHRKIIQHPEKDKSSNELQKKSLSVLGKSCFITNEPQKKSLSVLGKSCFITKLFFF
jgi:hypothetical protein